MSHQAPATDHGSVVPEGAVLCADGKYRLATEASIVLRADGKFLGLTAQWHAEYPDAQIFSTEQIALRALGVASRIEPAIASVITVDAYESGQFAWPGVSSSSEAA